MLVITVFIFFRYTETNHIRWIEHERTTGKSETAKHLADNKSHMFTWKVLASASLNFRKRKILEAFFITKFFYSL